MSGIGPTVPILGVHASPPPYGLIKSIPAEYVYVGGSLPVSALNEDDATAGHGVPDYPSHFDGMAGVDLAQMSEFNALRWENGFQWEPERGALTLGTSGDFPYWWICPEGAGATAAATVSGGIKPTKTPLALRTYRPYAAHAADKATTIGYQARDRAARASRMLEANLSRIIEFEFWTGTVAQAAGFPNDFLLNSPTALNGSASTGYLKALAELEQALADSENGPFGVIHAQPRVVSLWSAENLLVQVPGTSRLVTRLGNVVVAGQGYPGTGPGDSAARTSTSTTSWAFCTDAVRVALSAPYGIPQGGRLGDVGADAMDRTVNDGIYRAERTVAAFFDATVKAAVKVNLASEL